MSSTTLLQRPTMTVSDFRCTAEPGERPFTELHRCHSISFARKGSFGYAAFLLDPDGNNVEAVCT